MKEIFEIAKSITTPVSLIALSYLILFLVFRAVLSKLSAQKEAKSYRLIRYLMTLTAALAILGLILLFSLEAYKVYSDPTGTTKLYNELKKTINLKGGPVLGVAFESYGEIGAEILIGNEGSGVVLVRNIGFHWDYHECEEYYPRVYPAPVLEYRYEVILPEVSGSRKLDDRMFQYSGGDLERFIVDTRFAGKGVYDVWFSLDYKTAVSGTWSRYQTERARIDACSPKLSAP